MAIVIESYAPGHVPAVKEFNRRLLAGGATDDVLFYGQPALERPRSPACCRAYDEYFLAMEGGTVRGAYAIKHQEFCFDGGTIRWVGCYHHPVSEGIVNKGYAVVATLLIRDALRRQPLLYALGMGGYDRPLPRMLKLLGWRDYLLPFYFKVVRPARFLRNVSPLRETRARRLLADLACITGIGWVALKSMQALKQFCAPSADPRTVEEVREFGDWADGLWEESKAACAMTAVRDGRALRALYPANYAHLSRLRISRGDRATGWAVIGERRKNPKFGTLRVGSIIDCLAPPSNAIPVVRAATRALEVSGVDLIVSNQSHSAWCRALADSGFLEGPSNFIFAASQKLAESLLPFEEKKDHMHFNRADGDGLPHNY